MDAQIRAIERRFDADPLDPESARMLARLHLRQGGLIAGRSVDAWIEDLVSQSDEALIREAFAVLGRAHPHAALAIPLMLERFARGALWRPALAFIRDRGRWSLPFLAEALDHADYLTRARAAEALGALGATAAPAQELFVRALDDPHNWVRHKAVTAVGFLGAEGRGLLPKLRAAARSSDFELRVKATLAAARLESDGAALPALRMRLISEDGDHRDVARAALLQLHDPRDEEGLEALGAWSVSRDALERFAGLIVLADAALDHGPSAGALYRCVVNFDHIPLEPDPALLRALLDDREPRVAGIALHVLLNLARTEAWALEAVAAFFHKPVSPQHDSAFRSLESMGERARPVLTQILGHPNGYLRRQARRVLQRLEEA